MPTTIFDKGETVMKDKITAAVIAELECNPNLTKREGCGETHYEYEMDCCRLDDKVVAEILQDRYPREKLEEILMETYEFDVCVVYRNLEQTVMNALQPMLRNRNIVDEIIHELVWVVWPASVYDVVYPVTLMIDTGDGNFDFAINSRFADWENEKNYPYLQKASLVWLAEMQGISFDELRREMEREEPTDPKYFLESLHSEIVNVTTHMNTVSFLTEMSLSTLLDINISLKSDEQGSVIIHPSTMTGLFDPWNGAGGIMGIALEREVKIPLDIIFSCLPDTNDRYYSASDVYGFIRKAWQKGGESRFQKITAT